eukprot:s1756_g1.t1
MAAGYHYRDAHIPILQQVERCGEWPNQLSTWALVLLRKTSDPCPTWSMVRPITIAGLTYRIWSRVRTAQFMRLACSNAKPLVSPCLSTRAIWTFLSDLISRKVAAKSPLAGLALDIVKAFNILDRGLLRAVMVRLGFNAIVVDAWMSMLHQMLRTVLIEGSVNGSAPSVVGIPEGDPLSVIGVFCFAKAFDHFLQAVASQVRHRKSLFDLPNISVALSQSSRHLLAFERKLVLQQQIGPGILLINLCSTVLAANHWALQLVILPIIGFSALLFTVLALFIIPKGFLILDKLPSLRLGRVCLLSSKASKIGDGTFHNKEMADVPTSSFLMSKSNSDTESGTSEPSRTEAWKILLSILLYSPELILGVLRMVRATWAQTTGSANWKPQDQVEREVETNLSLWYVFKQTWVVFMCGVAYLAYIVLCRVADPLVLLIVVPWILYPISTYVMCLRVPVSMKDGFLWTWVMEIKEAEKAIS